MDVVYQGFLDAISLVNLFWVAAGVTIGIVMGAIPGLNSAMAIAIAVPLTFTMSPLAAIGMLVGVMKGGGFGGAISATLLNAPGEPSAVATALDAYPLAKTKGKPRKALKMALFSSVAGDSMSDLTLILCAAPLAAVASQMGRVEQTAILFFAFTFVAGLSGSSLLRGVLATLLGVLMAQVGRIEGGLAERFTFGVAEFGDGLPLAAVAIGLLALPEIAARIAEGNQASKSETAVQETGTPEERRLTFAEWWASRYTILRGGVIGTLIGALPGLGASVAAFISYAMAVRSSRTPEKYGKGELDGIAASESANSAVNGANLIPLLTLGIPGNVSAALLVGAFIIHGVDIGPSIFVKDARLVYGLLACMVMANVMVLLIGQAGLTFFVWVLSAPAQIIFPIVVLFCVTGVYVSSGIGLLGVWVMLAFGVLGWLMRRYDFSIVCFIIGFVLGDSFERSLRGAVTVLYRDPWGKILEHPMALVLVFATIAFIVYQALPKTFKFRRTAHAE